MLLALGAGIGLGATQMSGGHRAARPPSRPPILVDKPLVPRPYPTEVRGVHVTAPLAGLPGKLEDYTALKAFGLNTIEVDVKDENGQVGFVTRDVPALAREIGAARPYYDVESVVARVHAAGMYLIGRVVVFEDPTLSAERPALAVLRPDGSRWLNNGGLGWVNPYDRRVWRYAVGIGEAAARAGFDEIQFDYVRFPSDGDLSADRLPPQARAERKGATIARFLRYASSTAAPARRARLRRRLRARRHPRPRDRPGAEEARRRPGRDLPDGLPVALLAGRVRHHGSRRVPRPDGRSGAVRLPPPGEGPCGADPLAPGLLARRIATG